MTERATDDALFAAARSSDVVMFVERASRVWSLRKDDEGWKAEVTRYIAARINGLAASDLDVGFSLMLKSSPVTRNDGGQAFPPGPHAMLGFILMAKQQREDAGPRKEPPTGPRRLHGHPCPKCAGPRDFLPGEGMIYCQPCNTVWTRQPGEVLEFADPPMPSPEGVGAIKANLMKAGRAMQDRMNEMKEVPDGEAA